MATFRTLSATEINRINGAATVQDQPASVIDQVKEILRNGTKLNTPQEVLANPRRDDLIAAAVQYANTYQGTFAFMLDMRREVGTFGGLSIAQIKGTLNCLRAQAIYEATQRKDAEIKAGQEAARKQAETPAPAKAMLREILDGFYTVSFEDGSHVTIRINTVSAKQARNGRAARYASYLSGPINTSDYTRFATINGASYQGFRFGNYQKQIRALEILMGSEDATEYGRAYARESKNCYRCGRLLTEPESIAAGIGPICAGRE